jgi:hypothetical protein
MEAHKRDMKREDKSSRIAFSRNKEHGTDGSSKGTTSSRTEGV